MGAPSIVDLAVQIVKLIPRQRLAEGYGIVALVLLYDELVKAKEIKRIEDLDRPVKLGYWKESEAWEKTEGILPQQRRYKRRYICQSLYLYDLLTK